MSICREWSLVKHLPGQRLGKMLLCRSWGCEHCAPLRKRQLMARAASGKPTRFLTLTINPNRPGTPDEHALELANAWRNAVKRLRRLYGLEKVEYLAVFEQHKSGEPHLHVLLRSCYIPQQLISNIMAELIDSPIVDIRKVRDANGAVRYVAKYVTKANVRFGTSKRYWFSRNFEPPPDTDRPTASPDEPRWTVSQQHLYSILQDWTQDGFACKADGKGGIVGIWYGWDSFLDRAPPGLES